MQKQILVIVPEKDIGVLTERIFQKPEVRFTPFGSSHGYIIGNVDVPRRYSESLFARFVNRLASGSHVYTSPVPEADIRAYNGLGYSIRSWNEDVRAQMRWDEEAAAMPNYLRE